MLGPAVSEYPAALLHELAAAVDAGEPVVLATVVSTCRSVPRHAGSKMLVYLDGRCSGSIGGGVVEQRVAADAARVLARRRSRLVRYDLLELLGGDPGTCGGEMTVYLEPHVPSPTVLVVGCGHVGRAVAELAHWLGFRVIATDDRSELLTENALPDADLRLAGPIKEALCTASVTEHTHLVLATRSMQADLDALPLLLATPARSVGVLGSAQRWQATRAELLRRGVTEEALARVNTPIGLDLGAESPREIALAILGQIVALHHRGTEPASQP